MMELRKGTTLIEASAGTGKTYTLCRIALQLTLQHGITLDRILAVTFTEAATEELASRIQSLYHSCLHELETGEPKEAILVDCLALPDFDVERAKNALRYSLEVFDEAPISTIHSFCKRSLELVALETQSPLDAELSQVEDELVKQLQSEYIRQTILEASSALSLAYKAQKNFEKRLTEIGTQTASHPEAKLRPTPAPVSIESLERRFSELPESLADLVARKADYLAHLGKARKPAKQLNGQGSGLLACVERRYLLPDDLLWLPDFTSENWSKAMNKSGAGMANPPATALVDVVLDQIEKAFVSLIYGYRTWLSERLERAKQQANVISFNDLLHHLKRALTGESGAAITSFLAGRYDAALIDEFQDTDRTQLEIARTIFGGGDHYLFYIGDPKQAIYRFRGADIYAYFQATGGEIRKEVLKKNYRSTPPLVEAVNTLFSQAESGFLDERIQFYPVEAGLEADPDTSEAPPFQIVQLTLDNPQYAGGTGQYRDALADRAANDFARRLNEDTQFRAEDVSFLVNSRMEAACLNEALLKRGISCAIRADRSVFKTAESDDLKQLLSALSSPTRTSLKRGAYAALDHSLTAEAICGERFEKRATPFFEYITTWARDWFSLNFDVAFHSLLRLMEEGSSGNGADLDSERRYANFCQLAELLSEARDAEELSPRGLYNWLCRKTEVNVSNNEDWQTRISSDEGKPQILTIHKSKGLQFPVVIHPFLGLRRVRLKEPTIAYHGPDDELIIDYAPEADSVGTQHANREALAEDIRLLYVTLTRAEKENLVYLCPEEVYRNSDKASSSFAHFLLGDDGEISSERLASRLQTLADESNATIGFVQVPLSPGEVIRYEPTDESEMIECVSEAPLENRARMPFPDRVLSFSALNKALHRVEDEVSVAMEENDGIENDESVLVAQPETAVPESLELSIFTLPKGTHAGDLLHLILERFDFSRPETLSATTQQAFDSLQFEPRAFEPIVAAQIGSIAKATLEARYARFSLESIRPEKRIPELEFAYPVSGDVKRNILAALADQDLGVIPSAWLDSLNQTESGLPASMLRGFIDLVLEHEGRLYIFDWKSNYLGPSPADYDQAAILDSMSDHNYFLQYLLYCVALKRYAQWRFPHRTFEESFGGVFYIYARGISPGKDTGIFYDLPNPELLDALDHALNAEDSQA